MLKTSHSLLSNSAILKHIDVGTIVVDPFVRTNLANSSYDVTLGDYFYRQSRYGLKSMRAERHLQIYNMYDESHVRHMWEGPEKADRAGDFAKKWSIKFNGVSPDDKVILIYPHETILAHTNEFIGGREKVTTMMKARSSIGRNFIEVCKCAGWGDIGYVNRWTMEITNNNSHFAIPLIVGRRIAQIIFFETEPVIAKEDYISQRDSKYSNSLNVEDLKKSWDPSQMLPKMWLDREVLQLQK